MRKRQGLMILQAVSQGPALALCQPRSRAKMRMSYKDGVSGLPRMPQLFRSMKEDALGLPQVGASARTLGIRPGIDVPATMAHDLVQPGQGGLSVCPDDPMSLPAYRRPIAFQGTGKDPVWTIDTADLGSDLIYRADPRRAGHGFIEPARPMTLDQYQRAVEQTQGSWRKVTSSGSHSHGS